MSEKKGEEIIKILLKSNNCKNYNYIGKHLDDK